MIERSQSRKYLLFGASILILSTSFSAPSEPSSDKASAEQLRAIQKYIKQSWLTLTRSNSQLAHAAPDPKFSPMAGNRWPVYLSRRENFQQIEQYLRTQMPAEDRNKIELRRLPEKMGEIREHGLLCRARRTLQ
jgi:hypothetical protein